MLSARSVCNAPDYFLSKKEQDTFGRDAAVQKNFYLCFSGFESS